MEHHIFLSYSRIDAKLMQRIRNYFRDTGFDVWTDEGIEIGTSSWKFAIERAIVNAGCLVCILSPDAAKSRWVREELNFADMHGKTLFLILARGDERESVPFGFAAFQWVDIRDMSQFDSQMDKLVDAIQKRFVNRDETAVPAVEVRELQRDYDTILRLMKSPDPAHLNNAALLWNAFVKVHGSDYDPEQIQQRLRAINTTTNLPHVPPRVLLQEMQQATSDTSFDSIVHHIEQQVLNSAAKIDRDDSHIERLTRTSPLPRDILKDVPAPPEVEGYILPAPFAWCEIPSGKVKVNLSDGTQKLTFIPQFYIAKYPITTAQFQIFVDDPDGYHDEEWWNFSEAAENWRTSNQRPKPEQTDASSPRTNISWYEAVAFCNWLTDRIGLDEQIILLPSEHQWQRAAQGDGALVYPWGNRFDNSCANTKEAGLHQPSDVTQYESCASPFGVCNMVGNVHEWCLTEFISGHNIITGNSSRVLRGGSYKSSFRQATCTYRGLDGPIGTSSDEGFRVVYTRHIIGQNS